MNARLLRLVLTLAALVLLSELFVTSAHAGEMRVTERARSYKQTQKAKLTQGARRRITQARALRKHKPAAARDATAGTRARPDVTESEETPVRTEPGDPRGAQAFQRLRASRMSAGLAPGIAALGANHRINNRAGDDPDAGQSEVSIAAFGNNLVAAWNDGQGFVSGLSTQGYAYSTDGGANWVDAGIPPVTGGVTEWTSDPVITVNEKTGAFYYSALCSPSATTNGVAVVRGTFQAGALVWETPKVVRSVSNASTFLDKPWVVADSSSGNLYVTYTNFGIGTNSIQFQRQTDPTNVAAWGSVITLSSGGDAGLVQGSRPAVGPAGEVYAVWGAIGQTVTFEDFFRIRKSTNNGQTFGTEFTAPPYFSNFGSGAPGFNRGQGVTFPSIAVDRSTGARRGRVYLAWNESVNYFNDGIGGTVVNESEGNDTPGSADLFSLGNTLNGTITTINDLDYYRFSGTAGQTVIFALTEADADLVCALRLFCTDGTSRLAFSDSEANGHAVFVFTIPTTGDYFVRVASLSHSDGAPPGTGSYTIDCGIHGAIVERSRDQRDVFVTFSDDVQTGWSTPSRVNDEPAARDDWLPEVQVSGLGKPYVAWYDFRDVPATCFAGSQVYLARSEDGGLTWIPNSPVTDTITDWTSTQSNLAPNQGDYLGLFANSSALFVAWADGRNLDVDSYMAQVDLAYTGVQVALASVQAETDRVRLAWQSAEPGVQATVYRRQDAGDWLSLGPVTGDGSGLIRYEDRDVTPGGRYGYRLGVRSGDGELFAGEVWVDVPTGARFALHGARPNPTSSDGLLAISFSLPDGATARLELLDVAGRRVRSREVGSLGAGNHVINLAGGSPLAPGLYVVRLARSDRSLTGRVSVVR